MSGFRMVPPLPVSRDDLRKLLERGRRVTAVTSGNAGVRARRYGRWLLVRGLASAAFRPGRWGVGLAVAGLAVPGPWWLASIGITALALPKTLAILTRSDHRSSWILSPVSRRVKSLKLRRRLVRRWTPLMVELGLSRQVERRPQWKPWQPAQSVTVTPALSQVELGEWGVRARVDLRPLSLGVSALGSPKITERIESGLVARSCSVSKIASGLCTVDLKHSDPLAETVRIGDLPAPTRHLHVVPRRAEDGRGVEQPLPPLHLEIGATRAGKSQAAWTLIKLILDKGIPLRLRIFDPKQQEFISLRGAAYDYESDVSRWPEFLGRTYAALKSRQKSLARRGITELRRFTYDDPLDLLILDEFLSVLGMRNADVRVGSSTMKAFAVLDQMASQMIAAGYGMVAASQLGTKDIIGSVRDLFPTASILRVPPQADDMVDAVLGKGSADRYPAHLIPFGRHTAGQGYTRTPSGLVLRTRVAYLTDDERTDLKEQLREETERFGGPWRQRQKPRDPEPAGAAA